MNNEPITLHDGDTCGISVGITMVTIRRLLTTPGAGDALALYTMYCYNARLQDTSQPWCNAEFAMKGLDMGRDRFDRARKTLKDMGLIEDVVRRDESGKSKRWFVKVRFMLGPSDTCGINHSSENTLVVKQQQMLKDLRQGNTGIQEEEKKKEGASRSLPPSEKDTGLAGTSQGTELKAPKNPDHVPPPPKHQPPALDALTWPTVLDCPAFRSRWVDWMEHRMVVGKRPQNPVKFFNVQLRVLSTIGRDNAMECVQDSLMNNFTGLFPKNYKPRPAYQEVQRPRAKMEFSD